MSPTAAIYHGDPGWGHTVLVEAMCYAPLRDHRSSPTRQAAVSGGRAGGAAGGLWGVCDHGAVLAAIRNPERRRSRRVRELLEWIEEDCDPEASDVPALNRARDRVR